MSNNEEKKNRRWTLFIEIFGVVLALVLGLIFNTSGGGNTEGDVVVDNSQIIWNIDAGLFNIAYWIGIGVIVIVVLKLLVALADGLDIFDIFDLF